VSEASRQPLENLGRALIRVRFPVIGLVVLVTAFFGWHAAKLQMLSRFDELLPKNHPFLKVHRENAETFGGANSVLVMLEVKEGDIFNLATLDKIFRMTQEIDKIYGVNHYSIESIAHRTNRTLHVGAGGLMEMQPVMETGPKTQADVERVKRIVHTSGNLYGVLVSLDNRSALLRASFIEGLLDHRKLFTEIETRIVQPFSDEKTTIWVAGEPQLYGWIYRYAEELWWILGATIVLAWVLLYLYFRDWRGALRPTLSGAIAAVWGLGFIQLLGFTLDPLTLVVPFFITARAISHSVQMHERYYEELRASGGDQKAAIIRSFAALFVPTLSGIVTDALGILAILLVPIEMLQKLALTASFWIAAITVSELLLNPILYMYLRPPDTALIEARQHGLFQRTIDRFAAAVVTPSVRRISFAVWAVVVLASAAFWTQLVVGDSQAVTPLLRLESPYNAAHARIQDNFGGVEPLIVVLQSPSPGGMQVPKNVRTIERFQRFLERDPDVGASFSFVDVITTMAMAINEGEPKRGVVPSSRAQVGLMFGAFFMGTSYAETARFMDPNFKKTAVFFYCKNHRGPSIRRIIARAQEFISQNPLEGAEFALAGGLIGVLAAANEELVRNDLMLNVVGYATMFITVAITYRSIVAAFLLCLPLVVANGLVNAYMGARGIGINVQTLPVITVGMGFGIDFAIYIVSRVREELTGNRTLAEALREALRTAGKAVTFTAATMLAAVLFWTFSQIRFNAEMGVLLGIWMAVSYMASVTLLPAFLLAIEPKFLRR
jgi:uncharacterized protein